MDEVATGKIVSHINLSYNVEKGRYTFDPDELQVIRDELKRKSKTSKRTYASNLERSIDLDFGTVRPVVEPSHPSGDSNTSLRQSKRKRTVISNLLT